jgi:hypothetical protein
MSRAFRTELLAGGRSRGKGTKTLKRILAAGLAALVINLTCLAPVALAQQSKAQDKAAHKNMKYLKRLKKWAKDDPVAVKLLDGTVVKGYLTEATDDHFVVTDRKTAQSTTINYDQVKDIGVGFGKKTKIALGITAGILILAFVCGLRCKD